ncbi:MAG: glycosyltransferase family 2 protein [Lachnospiraceae bacterium]|nr:glycosyltransferase family 2 protein [Lachnospiraceae bacterium]
MKILTIAIPCYNSQDYMEKCINSALIGGEDVEIIIVNDGSSDNTAAIADEYAAKYPTIVKAIHKENGGHGDAVNHGIENATGMYFKVVDSDDWLDEAAFKKILKVLKKVVEENHGLDLLLANYVYDKVGRKNKKVMKYKGALPTNRIINWESAKIKFSKWQYVLMHSVIYRTQLLKDCGVKLPKHTFYVDNIYLFKPMIEVDKLMYIDADLYHYYIGREGQSVTESTMVKRIDQQLLINRTLIEFFSKNKDINKQKYKFLLQYLDMMMCVASVICIVSDDKEILQKKKELWKFLKDTDPELHRQLRTSVFGITMNLPGRFGRFLSKSGYHLMQRIFGFN